uniref:DNA helicase n=1 Tax=Heterorhabditis bacteriophora TaxID=37862 RepID=A0A1I7XRU4_HETBA
MRVQIGTLLIYAMTIQTTFNYSDEEDFKDVDVLYRRRCLLLAKQHSEMVFREMTGGSFKPINACLVMKECKTLDSPISADFTVALLPESEDYIEIETTVQPQ